MFAYQAPNVYFESRDEGDQSPSPLRTDIAGFVGIAARGPVHLAVKIESWTQFMSVFGKHIPQAYLAYAVEGFFANGGQTCYVVRVVDPVKAKKANFLLRENCADGHGLSFSRNEQLFHITGRNPGVLEVGVLGAENGRFTLTIRAEDGYQEIWRNLSTHKEDPRFIVNIISPFSDDTKLNPERESLAMATHSHSILVQVKHLESSKGLDRHMDCLNIQSNQVRRFGAAGLCELSLAHFGRTKAAQQVWGLRQFDEVDEISLVAMPDIAPKAQSKASYRQPVIRCHDLVTERLPRATVPYRPEYPKVFAQEEVNQLYRLMLTHCAERKDRIALLDCWDEKLTPKQIEQWRSPSLAEALFIGSSDRSYYGAFYYPWLMVPDPLQLRGGVRSVPPSGYIAGMIARVDQRSGVHKPPANEQLTAVKDVTIRVDDVDYGRLNTLGVNLIRCYPGRGIRVAGARTLLLRKDSTWYERGYLNVRRLLIMIMESIKSQLQWTIFEANNPSLWEQIERVVRTFLYRLWQHGMLDGTIAEDAFSVQCNAQTNPSYEVEQGRIICTVGLRPPWPAEFIIVRIGLTDGEIELLE